MGARSSRAKWAGPEGGSMGRRHGTKVRRVKEKLSPRRNPLAEAEGTRWQFHAHLSQQLNPYTFFSFHTEREKEGEEEGETETDR